MPDDTRRQVERVNARIGQLADQLVRGLVLETDRRLVDKTPVDTGYAAGNWNIGVEAPNDMLVPSPAEAAAAARAREPGARLFPPPPLRELGPDVVAGAVVYVTNAVPYIEPLEHGHSRQAPAGMASVTAAELVPLAERIAQRLAAEGARG